MKIPYILTITFILALFTSCTEEKTFDLLGYQTNNVTFTAVNLSAGYQDCANSVKYNGYFGPDGTYRDSIFTINCRYNYEWSNDESFLLEIPLRHENEIWVGGNSEIEFTFIPSSQQEKSAKFTMPDGKIFEVTKENPKFVWTVTSEIFNNESSYSSNAIIAESEYSSGNTTYKNIGYVYLNLDNEGSNLYYDKNAGHWIFCNWTSGEKPMVYGNVNFRVTNETTGFPNYACSFKYTGYEGYEGNRDDRFSIDVFSLPTDSVSDPAHTPEFSHTKEVTLNYSNRLWAGGDNEIRIAYHPMSKEEKEVKLVLPDGNTMPLTPTDTVATFRIDQEFIRSCYNWNGNSLMIQAMGSYTNGGVTYSNNGYVVIDVDPELLYDKERSMWIYRDWISYGRFISGNTSNHANK